MRYSATSLCADRARVSVDTPYYKGEPKAMCMKAPMYDMVIGNMPGSPGWKNQTKMRSQKRLWQK